MFDNVIVMNTATTGITINATVLGMIGLVLHCRACEPRRGHLVLSNDKILIPDYLTNCIPNSLSWTGIKIFFTLG